MVLYEYLSSSSYFHINLFVISGIPYFNVDVVFGYLGSLREFPFILLRVISCCRY